MAKKGSKKKQSEPKMSQIVAEPAPIPVQPQNSLRTIVNSGIDRVMEQAIDDPLTAVARIDSITELATKLVPTLPGEFPVPIPRGIYDRMPESLKNTGKQLSSQQNPEGNTDV